MRVLNGKRILINGKGGSGKSTIAALFAHSLNKKGKKVALLDGDPSNVNVLSRSCMGLRNGPLPLLEYLNLKYGNYTGITEMLFSEDHFKLKISEIPARYYLHHENIRLFQAGKISRDDIYNVFFSMILQYFNLDDETVILIDNKAGIEYFMHGVNENTDLIIIVVSPEYESIRLAEKIHNMCMEREIEHVYAVLNKVDCRSTENDIKNHLSLIGIDVIGTVEHNSRIKISMLRGSMINDPIAVTAANHLIMQIANRMLTSVFKQ
ncbi:MAG: AAA family ATPase [Cyclobacteriaceae bacterium]|nr:AAA family ATPase [Cyclobacteriaceae bacterium]